MSSYIFITNCPKCSAVGVRMYFDGKYAWCSKCHADVDTNRR